MVSPWSFWQGSLWDLGGGGGATQQQTLMDFRSILEHSLQEYSPLLTRETSFEPTFVL